MPAPGIAYFVSPHGFGHAARSAAVMEALGRREQGIAFEIITTVPEWFFSQSLSVRHQLRPVVSDVGLIQITPILEDLEATVVALGRFWSGLETTAGDLIRSWIGAPPRLVVSDISPLGLEVARQLGVPSILVENFTWDWIYGAYLDAAPGLGEFARRYAELAATAELHIQCEPTCRSAVGATKVGPVSRTPRTGRTEIRQALGLDDADVRPLVLLTMGGMGWGPSAPQLGDESLFVALGGGERMSRQGTVLRLPNQSPIYPPDLVWAADAVIGKLGYSTVAECVRAGTRLGYLRRAPFPESPVLEEFVRRNLPSADFSPSLLEERAWPQTIKHLLALPAATERRDNGADEIAELLLPLLR